MRMRAEIEGGVVLRKVWATDEDIAFWSLMYPERKWEDACAWHVEGATLDEGRALYEAAQARPRAVSNGRAMEQRRLAELAKTDPIAALLEQGGLK